MIFLEPSAEMPKTPTCWPPCLVQDGFSYRYEPIERAELYQLSDIPPDASKVSGREQMPRRIKTNLLLFLFGLYFGAQRRVVCKG